MGSLMKWDKELPNNFYSTKSHMWILLDGKVRYSKRENIHATIWGPEAWNIPQRGYYNDSFGIIHCHGKVTPELARMLAKKFPRAMYLHTNWDE